MKAYLVTREPWLVEREVRILQIPFVEEEVLYVVDKKVGFVEVRGRENIMNFINQLKNERQSIR
ncbi:MAG: hypothetical protein ABWK05_09260 [Pyrobaculum sp.]